MASSISQLILDVQDLGRSVEFYASVLHLKLRHEEHFEGHHVAHLAAGNAELLLVQQPPQDQAAYDRRGGVVLNFRTIDLAGVLKQVVSHKTVVLRGVEGTCPGSRSVLLADPDGYALLVSESGEETIH